MGLLDIYQNDLISDFSSTNTDLVSKYNQSNKLENSIFAQNNDAILIKQYKNNDLLEQNHSLDSFLEEYSKKSFFEKDNIAGMLNVRGRNYQNLSIIDKMRGIQANRLNMDTNDLSLAEIYNDDTLDNRTMNGLYNITITDTYKNKKLFNAFHNLYTDGLLTNIEDTQDMGFVQKTYSQLEEENIFFLKDKNKNETKTIDINNLKDEANFNLQQKKNINSNTDTNLVFEDENEYILSSFEMKLNQDNIFKNNNFSLIDYYNKESNYFIAFSKTPIDSESIFTKKESEFKTNHSLSRSSQSKNVVFKKFKKANDNFLTNDKQNKFLFNENYKKEKLAINIDNLNNKTKIIKKKGKKNL